MKLYFDNELNILKDIHELRPSECCIISDKEGSKNYLRTARIIDRILDDKTLSNWIDNSKSSLPPDLINEEDSLMMEVMRVDDHSPDGKNNPSLARQREMGKEAQEFLEQMPKDVRFIANAVTDLPTDKDHNYKFYYSSFQRTLRKHLSKLEQYKKNHPNKKVIFLVFDETSGVYCERVSRSGNRFKARLHFPFCDNRFLNEFIDSELDYLMWYIPYNHYETIGKHLILPRLILFDIKNARNGDMLQRFDYDEEKMMSNEK